MKKVIKVIQLLILVFVVFMTFTNSPIYEARVHNNNPNRTIDEVAMALKINEFDYEKFDEKAGCLMVELSMQ